MITCKDQPLQYQTTFSNGKQTGFADTTKDKGGHNSGFRPHELLEASLASCLNMHLRMYASTNKLPLEGISTAVALDRSLSNEVKFNYSITLIGPLSPEQKERLYQVAKTCPVHKTLSAVISLNKVENIEA